MKLLVLVFLFFLIFWFEVSLIMKQSSFDGRLNIYCFPFLPPLTGAGAASFLTPLGMSTEWMLGSTPPEAMVTPPNSLFNSSSLRTANWMWRGTMRVFLLSRAALPASSRISAVRYSKMDARYTGAPAPTRVANLPFFKKRPMRATGNCRPALLDLDTDFFPALPLPPFPPFPFPDILIVITRVRIMSSEFKSR